MNKLTFADLKRLQTNQIEFLYDVQEKHGGIAHYKMLGVNLFFINDPQLIRELLIKNPHHTHRDPLTTNVLRRVTGDGVFIAEGEKWRRQRKLVQPAFHAVRIRRYAAIMAEYTTSMMAGWEDGQVVAVDEAFTKLTLRIIARTMYGVDIDAQTEKFGRLMQEMATIAESHLKMTIVPPEWLPTAKNRRQKQIRAEVEALLREVIHDRRQNPEANDDLLSMLLLARDEEGRPMDDRQLLDECLTLFFAGHETTAALLTWATHLLSSSEDVMSKLRQELRDVLGDRTIQYEDIARLPYLEAVLKETLRLYPPAYGFGRTAVEPFSIGDHHFPKRSVILVSTYITHHRPDLFPDPERFCPERFLDPDQQPDRYAYLPFGAGPRVCVGNMFAMMEASIILATLVQRVRLTRADTQPVVMDTRVTLRPRDPLRMRVEIV
ncbi:MAG: cytochrome P450 [Ardenticatenaceae bacterium]|nr:cytochrome P450 [Ardenticatenaceae bacterium]